MNIYIYKTNGVSTVFSLDIERDKQLYKIHTLYSGYLLVTFDKFIWLTVHGIFNKCTYK